MYQRASYKLQVVLGPSFKNWLSNTSQYLIGNDAPLCSSLQRSLEVFYCLNKRLFLGNFLVVQRGRASALTAVGPGSVSDWGTKIPQAMHGRKKKMLWGILWFSDLYPGSFRWTPCPSQFSACAKQELGCFVKITGSPRHTQGLQLGTQLFPPDHSQSQWRQSMDTSPRKLFQSPLSSSATCKTWGTGQINSFKMCSSRLQLKGFPVVIWQVFTTFWPSYLGAWSSRSALHPNSSLS